MPPQLTRAIN